MSKTLPNRFPNFLATHEFLGENGIAACDMSNEEPGHCSIQ
jgi:hypothetical protein